MLLHLQEMTVIQKTAHKDTEFKKLEIMQGFAKATTMHTTVHREI